MKNILGGAFFISGASAILYEVIWVRLLSLAFGGVTMTVSVVTALFLLGLALGAWLGGHLVDLWTNKQTRQIFLFYSVIEIGIAVFGLLNWYAFHAFSLTPGNFRFPVSIGLVFLQALIAGVTWPVMFTLFIKYGSSWRVGGLLAFLNTAGGAVGAFTSSFFLFSTIGLFGSFLIAAAGNILAAVSIFVVRMNQHRVEQKPVLPSFRPQLASFQGDTQWMLLGLAIAGFCGMAMEILWMRIFGLVLGSSIYAFTLVLTVVLLGLAFGGIVSTYIRLHRDAYHWLFALFAVSLTASFFMIPKTPWIASWWLEHVGRTFFSWQVIGFIMLFFTTFVPSFVSGAVFPMGLRLLERSDGSGRQSAKAYAANTMGAVAGGLVVSLVFIDRLGLGLSVLVVIFMISLMFFLLVLRVRHYRTGIIWFVASVIAIPIAFYAWDTKALATGAWLSGSAVLSPTSGLQLLSYKDGRETTVATIRSQGVTAIFLNGKPDASNDTDMGTQVVLGHMPLFLVNNPREVLVIGLGSGITAGAISRHEKVQNLWVVEIEPAVVAASRTYFQKENYSVLDNPKTHLVIGDGRNFLLGTDKTFDMITAEPSNPWVAGESNLFTQEYFKIAKKRLKDHGVFFQWLNLYSLRPKEVASIVKTFHSVFPYVKLFTSTNPVDIFLAGKMEPFTMTWARFTDALDNPAVAESLRRRGFDDEIRLFSLLWGRTKTVEQMEASGEIVTDDHPILEFRAPFGLFQPVVADNLRLLLQSYEDDLDAFDIPDIPIEEAKRITRARQARHLLVQGRLAVEEGDVDGAITLVKEGRSQDEQAPSLRRFLAELLFDKGVREKTQAQWYEQSITLNASYFSPYPKLIALCISQDKKEEAGDFIQKAKLLFPWSGEIMMFEGILAGMHGDSVRAETLLVSAREKEPWNVLIRNNLATAYMKNGKSELAIAEWRASLGLLSHQPEIRALLRRYEH